MTVEPNALTSNTPLDPWVKSRMLTSPLNDESNVKIPLDMKGNQMTLEERVRYLELKLNAFMNFGADPFFGVKQNRALCNKMSELRQYGCKESMEEYTEWNKQNNCPGLFDHNICLDSLPAPGTRYEVKHGKAPCLVYDFGIRKQPQFGATLAREFGCEVHAFDPVRMTVFRCCNAWWDNVRGY